MGDAAIRRFMGDGQNRKPAPFLLSVELARLRRMAPGESTDLVRLPIDPVADTNDFASSSVLHSGKEDAISFPLEENIL